MTISWGVVYLLLFVYRSFYSVAAEIFVARFTTLGDSQGYQGEGATLLDEEWGQVDLVEQNRVVATMVTDVIGAVAHRTFGGSELAINLVFQAIAFVGIVILLQALHRRERLIVLALFLLPSFNVWSSVAGKEAIVVFAMGILSAFVIRLHRGDGRVGPLLLLAVLITYFFKDHYLPAIMFAVVGVIFVSRLKQKASAALLGGLISLAFLFVFRDQIDQLAFRIIPHFQGLGSSRAPFWVEQYDVFLKAPLGMLLAFYGPTAAEAEQGILFMFSFVESFVLLAILSVAILPRLLSTPVYLFIIVIFSVGWLLFAAYPLGVHNPGSAIRYRTGFEVFIFAMLIGMLSRRAHDDWAESVRWRSSRRGVAA